MVDRCLYKDFYITKLKITSQQFKPLMITQGNTKTAAILSEQSQTVIDFYFSEQPSKYFLFRVAISKPIVPSPHNTIVLGSGIGVHITA